jgi:hypothetical protein
VLAVALAARSGHVGFATQTLLTKAKRGRRRAYAAEYAAVFPSCWSLRSCGRCVTNLPADENLLAFMIRHLAFRREDGSDERTMIVPVNYSRLPPDQRRRALRLGAVIVTVCAIVILVILVTR